MIFKETYKSIIDDLQPSAELSESLKITQEAKKMKFNKKKAVIFIAAACMLCGTTVFAAGKIASYRSWTNPRTAIDNYSEAVLKAEELGSKIIIPEKFTNGYRFDSANEDGREALDENGNVIGKCKDFSAFYVKENMPDIYMSIDQILEEDEENYAIESRMMEGYQVYFNQATYKFVPEDYELTEEDEKNMNDPHYEISYGSDQVEILNYSGISFVKDDKHYSMFSWDSNLTNDEWYAMAEELLE